MVGRRVLYGGFDQLYSAFSAAIVSPRRAYAPYVRRNCDFQVGHPRIAVAVKLQAVFTFAGSWLLEVLWEFGGCILLAAGGRQLRRSNLQFRPHT